MDMYLVIQFLKVSNKCRQAVYLPTFARLL